MNYSPTLLHTFAAATYNCGAYSAGAYNENTCTTTSGSTDGSGTKGGDSGLANTGTDVLLIAACGVVIVVLSVTYLVRSIRKAKVASH